MKKRQVQKIKDGVFDSLSQKLVKKMQTEFNTRYDADQMRSNTTVGYKNILKSVNKSQNLLGASSL